MMLTTLLFASLLAFSTPSLHGCSGGGNNNGGDGGTPEKKAPPKTCSQSLGEKINEGCEEGKDCEAQRDCTTLRKPGKGICIEKLCVTKAEKDVVARNGNPDFSCVKTPPKLPDNKGKEKAVFWGPVESFGLDGATDGVKVELYRYDNNAPLSSSTLVGEMTSTKDSDGSKCTPDCPADRICYQGSCVKNSDSENNAIGYFAIKDVPTNELLVIKTTGSNLVPTIQYGIWAPADKVKDGRYKRRAFVITVLSKGLIPPSAGIQRIAKGNGAIAGEIHDCNDDIIQNARTSFNLMGQKLAYFDPETDRPDPQLNETTKNGIYSFLNIKIPGDSAINMRAMVKSGGKDVQIANFNARLFPDSITILTSLPWFPTKK